jgi:two-component system, OmpR family, sensor histidine kinase AdeS
VIGRRDLASLRRWWRTRTRWPLTRQISLLFALTMLANAAFIIVVSNIWADHIIETAKSTMSPQAQRALERTNSDGKITADDLALLEKEFTPIQAGLERELNAILYILVAVSAVVTFAIGYLILGRMGKGLVNVANAARQIADGDLGARAAPITFASREEAQLTTDFNVMSASLQRAERELAESTASIAHELRTPLTILRGRLHGIADGVFELAPEEIDGLLFQVEGLGRLVDDLQTLSLANSDRLVLAIEHTDLAEEVRRVLAATGPDLEEAGLEPVLALSRAGLRADGARIRQVIGAVLANARRYAANSGLLRLTTRTEGNEALLEIVDYGPGLPDGADERAFDRFWRGEVSRSRNTGGTGLGLAVVRAIVEGHGGRATIGNHSGGGTIFEMRLPIVPRLHTTSIRA